MASVPLLAEMEMKVEVMHLLLERARNKRMRLQIRIKRRRAAALAADNEIAGQKASVARASRKRRTTTLEGGLYRRGDR
jgi:hypothetical protein